LYPETPENAHQGYGQKALFPPNDSIPVPLEIDANSIDEYHQCHDNVVSVQVWPFEKIIHEYLMNPFLFGNPNNLVNASNPWGKYISSDPDGDKEMLASYW
jgi:hypothetical protein